MKYLLFSLALLLFSCSSVKQSPSAKGGQSTLRARTLQGIDQALTPIITVSDMRQAFRLTIAYADSLHASPRVKVSPGGWADITWVEIHDAWRPVLLLVVAALVAWFIVTQLHRRIHRP